MAVNRNNPGAGDPWAINAAGIERMLKAAAVRHYATTVRVAAMTASEHWRGVAQVAFESSVAEAVPDLTMLADSLDATASALFTYGGQVARIKDEQEDLERRRAVLEQEREELAAKRDRYSEPSFGLPGELIEFVELADVYDRELQDMQPHFSQLDEDWEELVRRRERADAEFVADLSSTEVRGNVAAFTSDYFGNTSPAQLLLLLSGMSAADLSVLEAVHPEVLDRIRQAPPADVAAWWAELDSAGENGRAIQERLVENLPTLIGSLGGIPPLARVDANRLIAQDRLATVDAKIADLAADGESMRRATPGYYTGRAEQLELLENERTYLQRAIDGKVQLYLYQPDRGNIIEMIGTPGPTTTTTVTYTPGTFTSPHGFYADDGVQQVSRWLTDNDPGIVAFVWKQGDFPGEDPATGGADLFRIGEANEQQRALSAGELLHQFQTDLHASSSSLADGKQVAIGHSWGLAAITGSEVAGAHYDQVHSLAGAWMPEKWEEQDGTSYHHWSYTDALSMAQDVGVVGDGKVPDVNPAFDSHIYERDGDFTLYLPSPQTPGGMTTPTPPPSIQATTEGMANHDLIASSKDQNLDALDELLRAVLR